MSYNLGLAETINLLKQKGYSVDFNLTENHLEYGNTKLKLHPHEFQVDETYRFDEMDDPSDQSVLYAVSSKVSDIKGTVVNGYGIYSEELTNEMMAVLT